MSALHTTEGGHRIDTHRVMARDQWASDAELRDADAEDELTMTEARAMSIVFWIGIACAAVAVGVLAVGGWLPGGA